MPFNLINDQWLPARRLSGERAFVRPADITDRFDSDPILALDFPRPDWNAAVTEMLIGLLATVMAPKDPKSWHATWRSPPSPEILRERLSAISFAFNLDGDAPRCFQDIDQLADSEEKPITALLIDAPGENAEKKNTDLFVKRSDAIGFSPAFAAAALIALQTYAPSGGQGNRTSMRGGGPLTTLPMFHRRHAHNGDPQIITTLWDLLWASVPDQTKLDGVPTDATDPAWSLIFPWLAATRTSEKDRATLPEHGHPLQQFFGLPRRVRLHVAPAGLDRCALDGPTSATMARSFRQKNYGVKYEGWKHSLSPHRADKKAGLLPYHPQPGDGTYRDWLTWIDTPPDKTSERAACLDAWQQRLTEIERAPDDVSLSAEVWQSNVLACGYDMDNMKARGWLEARIPFFDPPQGAGADQWPQEFLPRARQLVDATDAAAQALRSQVKIALTGKLNREGHYRASENLPNDAFAELIERYWREMEAEFRNRLAELRAAPVDTAGAIREMFLNALRSKSLALFDEIAGTDELADQDARRIVMARSNLQFAFTAMGKVRDAAGLMSQDAKNKVAARRKAKQKETT
jgi:CRISPR system Cascade subunit CasA